SEMYSVSQKTVLARTVSQPRAGSWRQYSSQPSFNMQKLREQLLKARTSNLKSTKNSQPPNYVNSNLSKRPVIGGHARNNLKSAHVSIPTFKPFFEQGSATPSPEAPQERPASEAATEKPASEAVVKEPAEAVQSNADESKSSALATNKAPEASTPSRANAVPGTARFFFFGSSRPNKAAESPRPASPQPPHPSAPLASTLVQQASQKTPQPAASMNIPAQAIQAQAKAKTEPVNAHMQKLVAESKKLSRMAQEYGRRGNPEERRARAAGKTERSTAAKAYEHKRGDSETKKSTDSKWRHDGLPRRTNTRNANKPLGEGDVVVRRRRRKLKLPKKGMEVTLPPSITVDGLAKLLDVSNDHLLRKMANMGMDKLANNYLLTSDEASEIALEYEVVPIVPEDTGPELRARPMPEDMSVHPLRPPVVTIMGHVDHGKTTLLDTLRNSTITAGEAGGITQHIGAFSVKLAGGGDITFLDTPGHAAFSAMRARGANATDIVILVVAADVGVMPQTKAIQHAHDADVPIIVAVNKCDKPGVDPSRIQEELLRYGVQTEDMGGDIQCVEISALKNTGVEELAESVLTLSEVLDLRAEVDIPAHATVIESQVEKGRGNVASVLVKRGTLRVGDIIVAGTSWCKVRSMTDDLGRTVKEATPACAVRVMGWKDIPQAGDMVLEAESEKEAKDVVANRIEKRRRREGLLTIDAMNQQRRETNKKEDVERAADRAFRKAVWEYYQGLRTEYPVPPPKPGASEADAAAASKEAPIPTVPVVIKGDVSGTVEAVAGALKQLPSKKIRINVISTGVGPVTESDVTMAGSGSEGVVVAFNVKADKKTLSLAKRERVEIMSFRVIYKLIEDVEKLLVSRLEPTRIEEIQGEAVVQSVFNIALKGSKTATIAGSRVTVGSVTKGGKARVLRNGKELFVGDVSSLKNIKHDIAEATKGQEFGIGFAGFEDLQEGDIIQSLRYREIPQKLE
ncbi:translation initiation factor IF-2, partial [Coemansia sp. Benny D115]